jgi:hypothetical protein
MSKLAGTPQPAAMESADNDSSDSEPPEVIEPIAKYRSRRANAGLKMSALISEQENSVLSTSVGEDVYTSAYGGFDDDDEIVSKRMTVRNNSVVRNSIRPRQLLTKRTLSTQISQTKLIRMTMTTINLMRNPRSQSVKNFVDMAS